jgi:hypothetical protein
MNSKIPGRSKTRRRVPAQYLWPMIILLPLGCGDQPAGPGIPTHQRSEHRLDELPPDVQSLVRLLQEVPVIDDADDADVTPRPLGGDRASPVNALRLVREEIQALRDVAPARAARPLAEAARHLEAAWADFSAGSSDLSHLERTAHHLARAERALGHPHASAEGIRGKPAEIGQRMTADMLALAGRTGTADRRLGLAQHRFEQGSRAADMGQFHVAAIHFGGALGMAAKTVTFDVELFRQNIIAALQGNTLGHAFSIAYGGLLYQGGNLSGWSRTAADFPPLPQSPDKPTHVASVSKTLTAIVILRLLQENGLTPDAQVAPYLPSDWVLGTGVNSLTFAHFMTHSTGFGQNNVGNTYWELKAGAALPVPSTEFSYKNANFGLMRVAAAGLQGFDPAGLPDDLAGIITSALFIIKAQLLFAGIGASVYSGPSEAFPTIQYKFPDDGTPGYNEPNRSHQVGGYGWFISSNNLANVLANLMGAQTLLSPSMRATMKQEFLGFMDPGNYENWVGVVGDVPGVYYGHGGDWFHAPGELHTCAMAFPINVQAALVINSARGPGMAYQCRVLQTAFDNAWVAP